MKKDLRDEIGHLLPFCQTEHQRNILDALATEGSSRKAARALGVHHSRVDQILRTLRGRAALQGVSPKHDLTHAVPEPFHVKGTSTLYKDGDVVQQWVKTDVDKELRLTMMMEAIRGSFEDIVGADPAPAPAQVNADFLAVYPMGDPHLGMYAWGEETGEDFDLDIACRQVRAAMFDLVDRAPPAETAVILNLGDFFHSDNTQNRTMRSGNALDVDGRWAKVLRVGVDLMISCIDAALLKHKKVVVRNNIGNHDDHSSVFLTIALSKWFHQDERVTIDNSPAPFWFYRFGNVLIGSTHGDTAKPKDLGPIMATMQAKDWGETEHRYWYTGHIHSKHAEEYPGVFWESFRTLAAKDAWHAAQGYISGRDMQCIVLHKETGEEERHLFNISKFRRIVNAT